MSVLFPPSCLFQGVCDVCWFQFSAGVLPTTPHGKGLSSEIPPSSWIRLGCTLPSWKTMAVKTSPRSWDGFSPGGPVEDGVFITGFERDGDILFHHHDFPGGRPLCPPLILPTPSWNTLASLQSLRVCSTKA